MGHDQTLLDAVLATPGDDAPRLAFADGLEDDPMRAEFIRLACTLRADRTVPRHEAVKQAGRASLLLVRHHRKWAAGVAPFVLQYRFGGGFVEGVLMTAGQFAAHGATVLVREPVRDVTLLVEPEGDEPHLRRIDLAAVSRLKTIEFVLERGASLQAALTLIDCGACDVAQETVVWVAGGSERASESRVAARTLRAHYGRRVVVNTPSCPFGYEFANGFPTEGGRHDR